MNSGWLQTSHWRAGDSLPFQHSHPKPSVSGFSRFLQISKYPPGSSTDVIYRASLSLKTPFRELSFSIILVSPGTIWLPWRWPAPPPSLPWRLSRALPWQTGKQAPDGFLVSLVLLSATSAFLLAFFLGLSHCATPVPGLRWLGFQHCLPIPPSYWLQIMWWEFLPMPAALFSAQG